MLTLHLTSQLVGKGVSYTSKKRIFWISNIYLFWDIEVSTVFCRPPLWELCDTVCGERLFPLLWLNTGGMWSVSETLFSLPCIRRPCIKSMLFRFAVHATRHSTVSIYQEVVSRRCVGCGVVLHRTMHLLCSLSYWFHWIPLLI